jgi:hypothetical protein
MKKMNTSVAIFAAVMMMVVAANAEERTFYGESEEYSFESSGPSLAQCVDMTVTECGACAGDYASGNCPKECYAAQKLCIPKVMDETAPAAPKKDKKKGEAWRKLLVTITALEEGREAYDASLKELGNAMDALGACHNGKSGADAEFACHPALDARLAELEACHNGKGGKEAELKCHPGLMWEIETEAFIREKSDDDLRNDQQEMSQLFKFDIGAAGLASTDFRDTGIIAGALQIAANLGVTESFRFTLNGAFGGGYGRQGNVVWALGATTEFLLNDKGTVWLGPAVSGWHEASTDRNFNTFLGAGAVLRVLFPENGHGYFAVTALVGDNMHFIPDVSGEYDEVLHHHFGAGLLLTVGFSAFRDPK